MIDTGEKIEVRIWSVSEPQARVLWQLAHDWDACYEGPRFDQ